ncbi:MAG: HD domain-containing protein [Firmicutes bacterium]|nr:HD domain-containing protein [Bacillota bacterium]
MANTKKISDLRVGTKLMDDIYSPQGQKIISKGTVLNWQHLKDLYQLGLQEVMVNLPEDAPAIDAASTLGQTKVVSTMTGVVEAYHDMFEGIRGSREMDPETIEQCVKRLYSEVLDCFNLVAYFRAFKGNSDYISDHSVAVSAISMQIGLILGYDEKSIKELGTASLLHDIGKALLAPQLTARAYPLSQVEVEEMAKHPLLGVKLVSPLYGANSRISMGILQHHEKMDGTGYPLGSTSGDIPELARIIAVANLFDNLISGSHNGQRHSDYQAAEELGKSTFGQTDPRICRQFLEYLATFYVGNIVKLNTGDIGEVLRVDPTEPTRPLIRIGEKYVDLRSNRSLIIEEVVGY